MILPFLFEYISQESNYNFAFCGWSETEKLSEIKLPLFWHSRQQALRVYCPNKYTVPIGL